MAEDKNPLAKALIDQISDCDFAVLAHYFAPHGRDYIFLIEDCLGPNPGRHELTFTHAVHVNCITRVSYDTWSESWDDLFTDYDAWIKAGEPEGYVWGTNWSFVGEDDISAPDSTEGTELWSTRLGRPMFEASILTSSFQIYITFHDLKIRKVSDDISTISQVITPLPPPT